MKDCDGLHAPTSEMRANIHITRALKLSIIMTRRAARVGTGTGRVRARVSTGRTQPLQEGAKGETASISQLLKIFLTQIRRFERGTGSLASDHQTPALSG